MSAAQGNLAVVAPHVGALSETFIRRHMEDLLPGRTAVVAFTARPPVAGHWRVAAPTLVLDELPVPRTRPARAMWRLRGAAYEQRAVERFLRLHGTDVVLGEYLDHSLPWLPVADAVGARFFVHAHGYDVSERLRDPAMREAYLAYNAAGGVVTVSEVSRIRLLEVGLEPAKVHVIPCGVDTPPAPPNRVRQNGGIIRCLAVGRMVAKKAPILTLDAFRRAAEALPTLRLDYVGAGELLPAARQFVSAADLESRVTLHGAQPPAAVARLLAEADLFLQHSVVDPDTGDEEGLPVGILEAMAQGLPVVATRHAGIPEAVVEGTTGFLVHEGDSRAMGERLVAVARDPALRSMLGEAGWRRARERFSWDSERERLLTLLDIRETVER